MEKDCLVYFVREGDDNPELECSLETVKRNLPNHQIWFIGYKPSWAPDDIKHIPTKQDSSKYANVHKAWHELIKDNEISEMFTIMNDDFFIMKPTKTPILYYRSDETLRSNDLHTRYDTWKIKKYNTYLELHKYNLPYRDYELHIPMTMTKEQAKKGLEFIDTNHLEDTISVRSIIGNVNNMGGKPHEDVKISFYSDPTPRPLDFLSSNDKSFRTDRVQRLLRSYLK